MKISHALLGLQLSISALCAQGGAATATDFATFASNGSTTAFDAHASGTPVGRGLTARSEVASQPRTAPEAFATSLVAPLALRAGSVGVRISEVGAARGAASTSTSSAGTSSDAPGTTRPTQGPHAIAMLVPVAAGSTGTVRIVWDGQASAGASLSGSVDLDGDGRPDWRGVAGTPDQQQFAVTAGARGVRVVIATNASASVTGVARALYQGSLAVSFTPDAGGGGGVTCTWSSTSRACSGPRAGSAAAAGRLLALTLDVSGAAQQGFGVLIAGAPAAAPQPLPGSACSLVMDLGGTQAMLPFLTDANGDASLTFRVPAQPMNIDFQAVTVGLGRGGALGSTNGLNLVCR